MYTIPIQIEGIDKRRRSIGAIHGLVGFFMMLCGGIHFAFSGEAGRLTIVLFAAGLLSVLFGSFRKRIDPSGSRNAPMRYFQAGIFAAVVFSLWGKTSLWIVLSLGLWVVVCLLLAHFEKALFLPPVLQLTQDYISLPGAAGQSKISWSALSALQMRPDYVTLFRPDNKYTQLEVLSEIPVKDIEAINRFAQERISLTVSPSTAARA